MRMELSLGTLLVAPTTQDADPVFARAAVLIIDREPDGITTGIAINRPLGRPIVDTTALALLFIAQPDAPAFWGGPLGTDPAILAQFSATDGLEWFHLAKRQERPFPLPNVGVIAVAEHPEPFEGRILRARLFVGLCVWGRHQLEAEIDRGEWLLTQPSTDDLFAADAVDLWPRLIGRVD
jgi:putative AlgH/UPF0301 family transcriptional regulator